MCQLVIFAVVPPTAVDPFTENQRYHAGDVVEVVADNHVFGPSDLGPHVKLVKMPGLTPAVMAQLIASDVITEPLTGWVNWPRHRIWTLPGWAAFAGVIPVAVPQTWINSNAVQRPVVPAAAAIPSMVI